MTQPHSPTPEVYAELVVTLRLAAETVAQYLPRRAGQFRAAAETITALQERIAELERERDEARRLAETWRTDLLDNLGCSPSQAKRDAPLPWEASLETP